MVDTTALQALKEAIREVSARPGDMRRLHDTLATHKHCEREWVQLLADAPALSDVSLRAEVHLPSGGRADLSIRGTLVEFKSTRAGFAKPDNFWATATAKDSAERWFAKDISRSHDVDGIFVLLVSSPGPTTAGDYAGLTPGQAQLQAISRYLEGLPGLAERDRSPAQVDQVNAGRSNIDGVETFHDALVISWPGSNTAS